MLSTELRDAALAFSHALREAPAVAEYLAASAALAEDPSAQQAMLDLQGPQASYLRTQQAGLAPTQEQVDQLRRSQAAVRANAVLMNHLRAHEHRQEVLAGRGPRGQRCPRRGLCRPDRAAEQLLKPGQAAGFRASIVADTT